MKNRKSVFGILIACISALAFIIVISANTPSKRPITRTWVASDVQSAARIINEQTDNGWKLKEVITQSVAYSISPRTYAVDNRVIKGEVLLVFERNQ